MTEPSSILGQRVYVDGAEKPFGEWTLEEVKARSEDLRSAAGVGPLARIGSVARAWTELARRMQATEATVVADLDPAVLDELATPLWVNPRSLLGP